MNKKEILKENLPLPLFKFLSYSNVYRKRIFTWFIIVAVVRGVTLKDQVKLLTSAFLGFFLSFHHLSKWQDPVMQWDAKLKVKDVGIFFVRRNTDDLHHINPNRESEIFNEIKEILSTDDIFIDAGANIGFYSVLSAKQVGQNGRVIAVEMLPVNYKMLKNNIDVNELKNVEIINNALSNKEGDLISISVPDKQFGQATIINNKNKSENTITVETARLDQVIGKNEKIALLKIDTEGAERLVLEGAEKIIQNIDNIIFEMHDEDPNKNAVFNFLKNRDYEIFEVGGKDYLARKSLSNNEL